VLRCRFAPLESFIDFPIGFSSGAHPVLRSGVGGAWGPGDETKWR